MSAAAIAAASFEHLRLVAAAMLIATLLGVPLGVLLTRSRRLAAPVLGLAAVLQTVPSLALLGLLLPLPLIGGLSPRTAVVALVLYALLPIVRNTFAGIRGIDPAVREAAVGMGMTDRQVLRRIELPLALGTIFAGIRIATVISVGVATVAAAIGAGGLGTFIFRGLAMLDDRLILAGALPAAAMALVLDLGLGRIERRLSPPRPRASASGHQAARLALAVALLALTSACGSGGSAPGRTDRGAPGPRGAAATESGPALVVGSKNFTESILLGEILAQVVEGKTAAQVTRRLDLGGSFVCDKAIRSGDIDLYPEYVGTALSAILKHEPIADPEQARQAVAAAYARDGLRWGPALGFENTFAMLVRGDDARKLSIATLSQAAAHAPRWTAGFGYEFESRADGWPGLSSAYGLKLAAIRTMDLGLTYRALAAGEVDVIAGNSTDGLIAELDLVALTDDRRFFPPYQAAPVARAAALARVPGLEAALDSLAGRLSAEDMRRANREVDSRKRPPAEVARELLRAKGLVP